MESMDIKELDKKQLVLLTLLITFVVSIATGIVTVSLMNQMPKAVPQTINNVIQRTIEKVTTVQVPVSVDDTKDDKSDSNNDSFLLNNNDALVSIYKKDAVIVINPSTITPADNGTENANNESVAIGQGIIISDIGLILVDSNILSEDTLYKVVLDNKEFSASILKKFSNGFTILKISVITNEETETSAENTNTGNTPQ